MATVTATILYGVPDDTGTNQIRLYDCATIDGSFSLVGTYNYTYGVKSTRFTGIDTTKFYKIEFNNSTDSRVGPKSEAIAGSMFDQAAIFGAISSGYDRAGYSTAQDVWNMSNLTVADVTEAKVLNALRTARSYIDLMSGDYTDDVFSTHWASPTARRKYNARLDILKKAEQNYALAIIYSNMADDLAVSQLATPLTLDAYTDADAASTEAISIGATSISGGTGRTNQQFKDTRTLALARLNDERAFRLTQLYREMAQSYNIRGNSLLRLGSTPTIPLSYSDNQTIKRNIFDSILDFSGTLTPEDAVAV